MNRVIIGAMGHGYPEHVVNNDFFNRLSIDSSSDWIVDRIGIRQRRSVLKPEDILALRSGQVSREELVRTGRIMTIAQLAVEPWELLKKRADLSGHLLNPDLVIAGTSVPDWDIPANACAIASSLALDCAAFDVNSACSSFVVDLHVARGLLKTGVHHQAIIFNVERYSTRLDYGDRNSCVLFGDGAAAALVQTYGPESERVGSALSKPSGAIRGFEVLDTLVHSNPSGFSHVVIPDGGTFSQNGAAVQKFAVTKTVAITQEILKRNELTVEDLHYFIGHQANLRMLFSVREKLGLKYDQHLFNVDLYGNQGGAGAPAVLSQNWNRFKPGDYVVISVVGAGLTWGSCLLKAVG